MNAAIARLRAEVASDLLAFEQRFEELRSLPPLAAGSSSQPALLAQAAVALHHGYSAVEAALARITKTLEGSVPEGRDWHQGLLANATLEIEGVRGALISPRTARLLHTLLGFRHFFRHAYGVPLDADRLEALRTTYIDVHPHVVADFSVIDTVLAALARAT